MHINIDISKYFQIYQHLPTIDVRSPSEYSHAHIPNAINIPLFDDVERAIVGTTYKQESREQAIKIGLDYFGPKMRLIVEEVEGILSRNNTKDVVVHCWRGGMRSGAVAWLLGIYGFKVHVINGGYKAFRNWVLQIMALPYQFKILGGNTGSHKTRELQLKKQNGEAVIDLEDLAKHKGSAFGHLGLPPQPSQEMFENLLALELYKYKDSEIWLEDECQRMGHVNIPTPLWKTMKQSPISYLDVPFDKRLQNILDEYGNLDKIDLINGIDRIKKRLGGLNAKLATQYIIEDNIEAAFTILIQYYDKSYGKNVKV